MHVITSDIVTIESDLDINILNGVSTSKQESLLKVNNTFQAVIDLFRSIEHFKTLLMMECWISRRYDLNLDSMRISTFNFNF